MPLLLNKPVVVHADGGAPRSDAGTLLRRGDVHGGCPTMPLIRAVVSRLRVAFPECVIELRADSALALREVYQGCEKSDMPYTVSPLKNERLKALAEQWVPEAKAIHADSGEKAHVFGGVSPWCCGELEP